MRWRRKRRVRVHLAGNEPSLEGFFTGFWAGHYIIEVPTVIASTDSQIPLESPRVDVPKEKVLFLEQL